MPPHGPTTTPTLVSALHQGAGRAAHAQGAQGRLHRQPDRGAGVRRRPGRSALVAFQGACAGADVRDGARQGVPLHQVDGPDRRRTRALPALVNSCNCMRSSLSGSAMYRMFVTASITGMETVDHGTLTVSIPASSSAPYTERQGQYLAFIHAYTKVNGRPPAQADMQRFFAVTAPSVHQMLITLERRGLLRRTPGRARSLEVLIAPEHLPNLR